MTTREGSINTGRHDNKITENGQGNLDISKTKDVREAGGNQGQQDDQDNQE